MSLSSPEALPDRPSASRRSLLLRVALGVVAAILVGAAALAVLTRRPPLPQLGTLPAFALVDQSGQPFTHETLRGRPYVADFIFTTCGSLCPAMSARMAQLQSRLPGHVALVSFTVDPGHDTPEVLARYAADFKAGPRWHFATGSRDALYGLATRGFLLAAMEIPPDQRQTGDDGPFLHSSKFVLVDGAGGIRGYYDSEDRAALDRLVEDARHCPGGA